MYTVSEHSPVINYNINVQGNAQVYFYGGQDGYIEKPVIKTDNKPNDEIQEIIKATYSGKKKDNMLLSKRYYKIAALNGEYYQSKGVRLENCSNYLAFAKIEGKYRMIRTNLCRVRLCPMCSYKRSLAVYRNTRSVYDYLVSKTPHSKFLFLTLTIENVSPEKLKEALNTLNYGWRKLTQYEAIKKITLGTLRTIEVTYNSNTGKYHPHIHILLHTTNELYQGRNYISQKKLTDMWAQAVKSDYMPIVDIRRFRSNTGRELAEVAKYAVKPSDYLNKPDGVIITLDDILHKRKLVTYSGSFREAKRELKIKDFEEREEYASKLQDIEAEIIIYRWHFGSDEYVKEENILKIEDIARKLSRVIDKESV